MPVIGCGGNPSDRKIPQIPSGCALSGTFGSLWTCPGCGEKDGAGEGTRTPDPIITNDVLYQLSYTGILLRAPCARVRQDRAARGAPRAISKPARGFLAPNFAHRPVAEAG